MQLTMHTNELHGTKFYSQANPKKIGYYTFFVLASTNNQCDFFAKSSVVYQQRPLSKKVTAYLNLSTSI
jgi:hypothetical protein